MSINVEDLKAFLASVDAGSVVGAAERIHLSQSAVSRRLQSLEDTLQTQLLLRESRPLQPTAAGKQAYAAAAKIIASLEDLEGRLSGNEKKKEFRFGISRTLGDLALVDPIRTLQAKYEDLELQATVDWTGTLIEKLEARRLDAAVVLLRKGESLPMGLHGEAIGTRSVAIVRAKRKRRKGTHDPSPFSKVPWIVNPKGCQFVSRFKAFSGAND
jgi:DNA-binding transcriptional LysR family regulator